MGTVAIGLIVAALAPAPGDRFLLGDLQKNGAKSRAAVRAVTERLALGITAGAPGIFSRFDFPNIRPALGNRWLARLAHNSNLLATVLFYKTNENSSTSR